MLPAVSTSTPAAESRSSLQKRVALALILMISFYVLALGVAAALLWIAYADVAYTTHPIGRLVLACVVGAATILLAIVPRPDRFEAPGPRVTSAEEPHLFEAIETVAAATGQAMPADVYIVNAVNAFVTHRGGMMGIGSRRVMGIGLPLMQVLTVDEFKSVLAHEFGHYHGGDVALAPWIYKT
jgi:Zn-dependent protease with chaperone function